MLTIKYRDRITPQEFIKYPLEAGNEDRGESMYSNPSITFREVARFIRMSVFYIAETLGILTDYVDDVVYLKITFLVYKILSAIQKDTTRQSPYW